MGLPSARSCEGKPPSPGTVPVGLPGRSLPFSTDTGEGGIGKRSVNYLMMEQQLPIHLLPPQAEGETARACTYGGREVSVISSGSLLPSVLSRTQGWLGGERERGKTFVT